MSFYPPVITHSRLHLLITQYAGVCVCACVCVCVCVKKNQKRATNQPSTVLKWVGGLAGVFLGGFVGIFGFIVYAEFKELNVDDEVELLILAIVLGGFVGAFIGAWIPKTAIVATVVIGILFFSWC